MKYVFLGTLAVLIIASILTARYLPDVRSDVPVIHWVTDGNPAREEQVKLFHHWLMDNGHHKVHRLADAQEAEDFLARNTSPAVRELIRAKNDKGAALLDGTLTSADYPLEIRVPKVELKLDMANSDRTKKVIQGVSGVAGDIQDQSSGSDMRYFRAVGLNTDVTDAAREMGFDLSKTYAPLEAELALRGPDGALRQYQFPCNVHSPLYLVNKATFRQHGQPLPPKTWTVEEFERRGKAFVDKANEGLDKQRVFFANSVDFEVLRRTYGGSRFNETGTAAALDDATLKAMEKMYEWTYGAGWRLLPNAGDRASFTTDSGYGGADAQMFSHDERSKGQFGMFWTGRYLLIQFRAIDKARAGRGEPPLEMTVVNPPHELLPNTSITTRAAMVYSQGERKEMATLFLAFLASREYNEQIVKDGDALPPNPAYTQTDAYKRPAEYPGEWEVHEPYAEAALSLAVSGSYSPFVLQPVADRLEGSARDLYMNNQISAQEAVERANVAINEEIRRKLEEDRARSEPRLVPLYERLVERQKQIDALKARIAAHVAAGREVPEADKIPADWIENAFHKAYYAHRGWLKGGAGDPAE